jgi:hypothetical protein
MDNSLEEVKNCFLLVLYLNTLVSKKMGISYPPNFLKFSRKCGEMGSHLTHQLTRYPALLIHAMNYL